MFDTIHRYKAILDELPLDKKIKILDVGGGSESIVPFIDKKLNIVSCDISFEGKKLVKTVKCSAKRLPFKDNSFDYVISLDALEHIPEKDRRKSIKEMMRVAKEKLILACPCGEKAEKYENALIKIIHFFGKENRWLKEHIERGLPKKSLIVAALNGKKYVIKKNTNLNLWFIWYFVDYVFLPIQKWLGPKRLMKIYGPLTRLFNFGNCYRLIFIVDVAKSNT